MSEMFLYSLGGNGEKGDSGSESARLIIGTDIRLNIIYFVYQVKCHYILFSVSNSHNYI